ncbi:MAG: glycosyltransferase family 4 protein [Chloroflexi bacterium]|nr:glycosyltransferase family 4 protein [Chloroflexota bacterium]
MKILLLTPDLPYPSESGAAIRNIGIIRGLVEAGHLLTLASFAERPPDPVANPLYQLCESVHTVATPGHGKLKRVARLLLSGRADIEFRLASVDFERLLRGILRDETFDLIQFSGIEMGCYLPAIHETKHSAKVIYDALNAEAELQRVVAQVDREEFRRLPAAIYSTVQTRRLARFERAICQGVDATIAVSEEDCAFLVNHGGAPVYVMANGIRAADYAPPPDNMRERRQLVFSGKMDYRPNVDAIEWFYRAVFPQARRDFPDCKLVIVGRNPHHRLMMLADDEDVHVTGWVESVAHYLHSATVYIAPLRMGSGTRLKILQAMAAGCAVVSTSIGAAGLHDDVRGAIVVADEAEAFARAITHLLEDENCRRELGARAQERVGARYDWSALIPRLLAAYGELGLG